MGPVFFPFFAPGKGAHTDGANFYRQLAFRYTTHTVKNHSVAALFNTRTFWAVDCLYYCMVADEDIRNTLLTLVHQKGRTSGVSAVEAARHLRPHQWQEILDQVKLVADSLVREGKLKAVRQGDEWRLTES